MNLPGPEGPMDDTLKVRSETLPASGLETSSFRSPDQTGPDGLPLRAGPASRHNPCRQPGTAGSFLAEALQKRWRSYGKQLRKCQRDFSETTVHDLRVAARKLIAQLVMIEWAVAGTKIPKARRTLKGGLKALGELRDTQVQRLFIERRTARYPGLIPIRDSLRRRERRLKKSVAATVKGFKTRKLKKWISGVGERLTLESAHPCRSDRIATAAERATTRAFAEVVKQWRTIDPMKPRTVHRTRIAFKKFRYMVESLSPEFTGLKKSDLRALAQFQRRMGKIQDLEMMERTLADFAQKRRGREELLHPFHLYLQRSRTRTLRSLLKSADDLLTFWPPARRESGS
jgi:CHAD domain-containing protein